MRILRHPLRFAALLWLGSLAACDLVTTEPRPTPGVEAGLVVNSISNSVSVFAVDSPGAVNEIGLGAAGTPVTIAARAGFAAVPLGVVPAVAIVDLRSGTLARTAALPENSGATGAAFANDSIVIVANSQRNTVSPVNVRTGAVGAEIAVGVFPQHVVAAGGRVYVLNANLIDYMPAGTGSITVLSASTLAPLGTVQLSGQNPGTAVLGADGRLYVLNSGSWGDGDGSLSVVDTATLAEVAHHPGFGDFPGSIAAVGATLYVASWSYGVAVWNAGAAAFLRPPADAVAPGGVPAAAGVATDSQGRLYTLAAECGENPDRVLRLGGNYDIDLEVSVGLCPAALLFTHVSEP
jgi:hypothetical protein